MLTMCIPIYNFDVTELIKELSSQTKLLSIPSEIILIDDCSSEKYKNINFKICSKETYIQLEKNIGRAKIRNLFLNYAKFDNLLFLDCDSKIISKDFILKYLETIKQPDSFVICGGRIYDSKKPQRKKMLSWKYGINKESQPLNIRIQSPNKSFMTNNFLINRKIFEQIKFEEWISEYGHEDTLFGYRLKQQGISITHIENSILNGDIEDNSDFLEKTEKGIINLIHILNYLQYELDFINDLKILKVFNSLRTKNLTWLINTFFYLFKPIIKYFLTKGYINLTLFNFYKLGILSNNYKRH